MHGRDIIVVGASMGGVEALSSLVAGLPPGLPAALFVVCHFPAGFRSILPDILSRCGPLLATHPRDGEPIHNGQIYVAPADHHLLLEPGVVRLSRGPRENRHRPAIDPLFRTAARTYGRRVVGVILTGALSDGAAGLLAVRSAGGVAVVQDPRDALVAAMPQNARQIAGADHVVPLAELAPLLVRLVQQPVPEEGDSIMTDPLEFLPEVVAEDMVAQEKGARRGEQSVFTCPECGGVMWQVDETELTRFRCHTGHAFYGEQLLAEQSQALEAALWVAVRIFKEKTVLARQLADRERQRGNGAAADSFDEEAQLAERYGALIQQNLLKGTNASSSREAPPGPPAPDEEKTG